MALRIRTTYLILTGAMAALLALLIGIYWLLSAATAVLEQAHNTKYSSYALADELRRSSDDLTRFARTYAVTGDERYEKLYHALLDIRNGKKLRPVNYDSTYWDFAAISDRNPRADSADMISLIDLMKKAGFQAAELAKLAESAAKSDDLVKLEVKAMNAVKGLFLDSNGQYTVKGVSDLAAARDIMHSRQYHLLKAQIMKPIEEFYAMLETRTDGAVNRARIWAERYKYLMGGVMLIMISVIAISGWVVLSNILSPVVSLSGTMRKLASNDHSIIVPFIERRDEVGEMANAVQVFRENMIEAERLRTLQEQEREKQLVRARKLEQAVVGFDRVIGDVVSGISSSATQLHSTAQSLSYLAEQTTQRSNVVAEASERMAQNVETVATATQELSNSIHEIGARVSESSKIIDDAVRQAAETTTKVTSLSEAARKIDAVVTLINEIASQTNLLALNATIEAARAGEAGKGFAVVASEVKNLAGQTAKATEEIGGHVRAIQESTSDSAEAIVVISQTINRVSSISASIASAVEEQGAATQEISRNIQQATVGTSGVSANISSVAAASEETNSGAMAVLAAAKELAGNGEKLRREVESFLTVVRNI